jgi:hypothetical protein
MKGAVYLLLFTIFSTGLRAQPSGKNDVIFKLNGEELSGKVIEINDNEVKFSYTGETLVYAIKKSEIFKINYASGRSELFSKTPPAESAASPQSAAGTSAPEKSAEIHLNRVAVLPFSYVADGQPAVDAVSEKVQTACYTYLTKNAGKYKIVDPRTTNAQLIKAGITRDNIKGHTMDELCNILGVEYVVEGLVTVNKSGFTSHQTGSGNSSTSMNDKSNQKDKQTDFSSSTSAEQEYETSVTLGIYNDKGSNVYSQDRKSLLSTHGAYKNTLEYLLKRSPLYAK